MTSAGLYPTMKAVILNSEGSRQQKKNIVGSVKEIKKVVTKHKSNNENKN